MQEGRGERNQADRLLEEQGSHAGKKERQAGRKRERGRDGMQAGDYRRDNIRHILQQERLNSNMSGMTHKVSDTVT